MSNIKFSILIAVYNKENFLVECLDSVIKQTYKDFELIIVNDGSTDKSGMICENYVKAYPHHQIKVFHISNSGALMAKRETLKYATGDYFVFSDADDILELNLLECLYHAIMEKRCDMYLYNAYQLKDLKRSLWNEHIFTNGKVFDEYNKSELLEKMIETISLHSLCTKAVKREIIDWDNNYSEWSFVNNGDDLLQSLAWFDKAQTIQYLDIALYNYRYNESGISKKYNSYFYISFSQVYKKVFDYLERWNLQNQMCKVANIFLEIIDQDIRLFISDNRNGIQDLKDHLSYILQDSMYLMATKCANISKLPPSKRLTINMLRKNLFLFIYIYRKVKPE